MSELGPPLEDAAYDCLSALAGVETYDVNLRDHGDAWAAIEAFAAKVRAAERERCIAECKAVAADVTDAAKMGALECWRRLALGA